MENNRRRELQIKALDAIDKINEKRSGNSYIAIAFSENIIGFVWYNNVLLTDSYLNVSENKEHLYDYFVAIINPAIAKMIKNYSNMDTIIADDMINPFIEIEKRES